ncbi:MAG TPA: hypothetical protein DCR93_08215, partial [Cytophagales bacterium]|nr:hypothetical protein [Cytophagales bacterium]
MKTFNKKYCLRIQEGGLQPTQSIDLEIDKGFTFAAWLKPTGPTQGNQVLLTQQKESFVVRLEAGKLALYTPQETYLGSAPIPQDKWVHIALSYRPKARQNPLRFYVNGLPDRSFSPAQSLQTNKNKKFLLGTDTKGKERFSGVLGAAILWSKGRSGLQVQQDFAREVSLTDPTLEGLWNFEDGTGNTAKDLSPKGNHLTATGTVTWEELQEPIRIREPQKRNWKRTTVHRRSALMAAENEDHEADPTPLPVSGRNGEMTKFLNRVTSYKTTLVANKQQENTLKLSLAQQSANDKLSQAHQDASKLMNSTRFDQIWFIYLGQIYYVEPDGTMVRYSVSSGNQGVDATDLALDVEIGLVFWINQDGAESRIRYGHMSDPNNSVVTIVQSSDVTYLSVALDTVNKCLYALDDSGTISTQYYRPTGDITQVVQYIKGLQKNGQWQLAVDAQGGRLYWTTDESIWTANTDGTDQRRLIPNHEAPFPIDLAVDHDSGKIYWMDQTLRKVRRANLADGSLPEDLYQVEIPVRGLALDFVSEDMQDLLKQEIYWVNREEHITPQTPGIVGTWPLDEGKGKILHNTLLPLQDIPLGIRRIYDDLPNNLSYPAFAFRFDGADFGQVPDRFVTGLSGSSFTIELWVKPDQVTETDQGLLAALPGDQNTRLLLLLRNQKAYMSFYANDLAGTTDIPAGKWTHLAFRYTYDTGTQTGEMAIFVNGVLDASGDNRAPLAMPEGTPLWVGHFNYQFYTGLMADVRMLLQPLQAPAIQATMLNHKEADLMDELITAPMWNTFTSPSTIVPKQAVLQFNGHSNYQRLGTASQLRLTAGSFTQELWVKPQSTATDSNLAVIGTETAANLGGFVLGLYQNKPYFSTGDFFLEGQQAVPVNEWSHLVCRYDADTQL